MLPESPSASCLRGELVRHGALLAGGGLRARRAQRPEQRRALLARGRARAPRRRGRAPRVRPSDHVVALLRSSLKAGDTVYQAGELPKRSESLEYAK